MTTTNKFTCSACFIAFTSFEQQREHYQSEWHRYNLNRRVRGHPPLTDSQYSDFCRRQNGESADSNSGQQYFCKACGKNFNTENAFISHNRSKKHLLAAESFVEQKMTNLSFSLHNDKSIHGSDIVKINSEEELEEVLKKRLSANKMNIEHDCIFCDQHKSKEFAENVSHMISKHGLYIPDQHCLVDERGLIQYLADKVAVGYCLACDEGKSPFACVDAVRQHMHDKGHLRIRFDQAGSAELSDFYNWEGLFTDDEDALITPDGTELILFNNTRIGNRAYGKYYKQYLRVFDEVEFEERESKMVLQALARSRGQDGQYALTDRVYTDTEKRVQRTEIDHRREHNLALGVKRNKFQPYLRLQIR